MFRHASPTKAAASSGVFTLRRDTGSADVVLTATSKTRLYVTCCGAVTVSLLADQAEPGGPDWRSRNRTYQARQPEPTRRPSPHGRALPSDLHRLPPFPAPPTPTRNSPSTATRSPRSATCAPRAQPHPKTPPPRPATEPKTPSQHPPQPQYQKQPQRTQTNRKPPQTTGRPTLQNTPHFSEAAPNPLRALRLNMPRLAAYHHAPGVSKHTANPDVEPKGQRGGCWLCGWVVVVCCGVVVAGGCGVAGLWSAVCGGGWVCGARLGASCVSGAC